MSGCFFVPAGCAHRLHQQKRRGVQHQPVQRHRALPIGVHRARIGVTGYGTLCSSLCTCGLRWQAGDHRFILHSLQACSSSTTCPPSVSRLRTSRSRSGTSSRRCAPSRAACSPCSESSTVAFTWRSGSTRTPRRSRSGRPGETGCKMERTNRQPEWGSNWCARAQYVTLRSVGGRYVPLKRRPVTSRNGLGVAPRALQHYQRVATAHTRATPHPTSACVGVAHCQRRVLTQRWTPSGGVTRTSQQRVAASPSAPSPTIRSPVAHCPLAARTPAALHARRADLYLPQHTPNGSATH